MELEARKRFLINTAFIASAAAIIYFIARFLLGYLLPFVIGAVLGFLLQKPARAVSKKLGADKGVCAAVMAAAVFIAAAALIGTLIWQFFIRLGGISERLTGSLDSLSRVLSDTADFFESRLILLPENMSSAIHTFAETSAKELISRAGGWVSSLAASAAKGFPSFLLCCVVTFAASCYIAKDFDGLKRFVTGLLRPSTAQNLAIIKDIIVNSVLKLGLGYLIIMLITFCELLIGFFIIGAEHAFVMAAVTAVVDLLPVLGTGTVLLPWAILCFASGNAARAVGLIIIYIAVTVVRNLIEPRIIGKQIGITPLLTLLTMFLGLRIAGIAGMILLPLSLIVVISFYKRQMEQESMD